NGRPADRRPGSAPDRSQPEAAPQGLMQLRRAGAIGPGSLFFPPRLTLAARRAPMPPPLPSPVPRLPPPPRHVPHGSAPPPLTAFHWVLPPPIPDKGRVLTALTLFWLDFLGVRNHLLGTDVAALGPPFADRAQELRGRTMLVRKTEVVPIECVVRGYLAGSGW